MLASDAFPSQPPGSVSAADLKSEIQTFLTAELAVHLSDIHRLDPPPGRVAGALTTGDFSWGTFLKALVGYQQLTGKRAVAGRDIPALIGQMGLIEARKGGKTWAQLDGASALLYYGANLNKNAVWQSLTPAERKQWQSLLDTSRFYNARTQKVIDLPSNYYGVAARIAAIDYRLGLLPITVAGELLDRAAEQFTSGAIYSDDAPPTGRYDRYPNEYARDLYEAAAMEGRKDMMQKLSPSLKRQMQLWWDILSPDGYGYNWGRTIGDVSYMDTLEIVAFLAEHPEFRPAPLPDLAAAYYQAWRWLRQDYSDTTHQLSVFAYGRGSYSYINEERWWQQTTQFFGKLAYTQAELNRVLSGENISNFPVEPALPPVARFEFFRHGDRPAGVWVVRQGRLRFALAFTTGPQAGIADYQPQPAGLPGFAVPVEQFYPCLVPFITPPNNDELVASDGADELIPSPDGHELTARWQRWVHPGGKPAVVVHPGITATVRWKIEGEKLVRTETLTAEHPVMIRRWWVALPSTASKDESSFDRGSRLDRFISGRGELDFRLIEADWPLEWMTFAPGNGPLGKGARRPIPLYLVLSAKNMVLEPGHPRSWACELEERPAPAPGPTAR